MLDRGMQKSRQSPSNQGHKSCYLAKQAQVVYSSFYEETNSLNIIKIYIANLTILKFAAKKPQKTHLHKFHVSQLYSKMPFCQMSIFVQHVQLGLWLTSP